MAREASLQERAQRLALPTNPHTRIERLVVTIGNTPWRTLPGTIARSHAYVGRPVTMLSEPAPVRIVEGAQVASPVARKHVARARCHGPVSHAVPIAPNCFPPVPPGPLRNPDAEHREAFAARSTGSERRAARREARAIRAHRHCPWRWHYPSMCTPVTPSLCRRPRSSTVNLTVLGDKLGDLRVRSYFLEHDHLVLWNHYPFGSIPVRDPAVDQDVIIARGA